MTQVPYVQHLSCQLPSVKTIFCRTPHLLIDLLSQNHILPKFYPVSDSYLRRAENDTSWQSSSIHPPLPAIRHGVLWYGIVWHCMVGPAISHGHQKGETWAYRPPSSVQCIFVHMYIRNFRGHSRPQLLKGPSAQALTSDHNL